MIMEFFFVHLLVANVSHSYACTDYEELPAHVAKTKNAVCVCVFDSGSSHHNCVLYSYVAESH